MNSSYQIKKFILDNLSSHERDIIHTTIKRFGLSRQGVLKHMHSLIDQKQIVAHGKTRDRFYELIPQVNYTKTINLDDGISSEEIIKNNIIPHIALLPKNIREIIQFTFGALISNIVDHSKASKFYFKLYFTYDDLHIIITDNGTGIFGHIQSSLLIESAHFAAIEIAKGTVTTDPMNHSGDELNAVIKLFDNVQIESTGKTLKYSNNSQNWSIKDSTQNIGTRIHLKINPTSKRTCQKIFDAILKREQSCLRIPIKLLILPGNELINSRKQAKNILRKVDDYEAVEFDFYNIDIIGPAFADELVRKTTKIYKKINIQWVNSNETIDLMMSRALNRFT